MVRNAHDDDADDFMPDRRDDAAAGKRPAKIVITYFSLFLILSVRHMVSLVVYRWQLSAFLLSCRQQH